MMKYIACLVFMLITRVCIAGNDYKVNDSCFLDSTELRLLLESNQSTLYYLEGDVIADTLKEAGKEYIMNYAVRMKKKLPTDKLIQLRLALLDYDRKSTTVNKCSFTAEYCIRISKNKKDLYFLFSALDFCGNQVKVVKLRDKKETSITFVNDDFTSLFK